MTLRRAMVSSSILRNGRDCRDGRDHPIRSELRVPPRAECVGSETRRREPAGGEQIVWWFYAPRVAFLRGGWARREPTRGRAGVFGWTNESRGASLTAQTNSKLRRRGRNLLCQRRASRGRRRESRGRQVDRSRDETEQNRPRSANPSTCRHSRRFRATPSFAPRVSIRSRQGVDFGPRSGDAATRSPLSATPMSVTEHGRQLVQPHGFPLRM